MSPDILRVATDSKAAPVFPSAPFTRIRARVAEACREHDNDVAFLHFAAAWTALHERFCELESADLPGSQRQLLDFLVSGVAVMESLAFGLFSVGALICPQQFVLRTPLDRRNATTGATMRLYHECFHNLEITRVLFWHYNSHDFAWWKDTRNCLMQEAATRDAQAAYWLIGGVRYTSTDLARKRVTLTSAASSILEAAEPFIELHLTRPATQR